LYAIGAGWAFAGGKQGQQKEKGAKIKPVQPTVIKDKKIIQDVIAEIHRKPTKKDMARLQERREVFKKATAR
jgi:hypothetical protein